MKIVLHGGPGDGAELNIPDGQTTFAYPAQPEHVLYHEAEVRGPTCSNCPVPFAPAGSHPVFTMEHD